MTVARSRWRGAALLASACMLMLGAAGCGGSEDPTAPREVRKVEVEQPAATGDDAAPAQDADAPSRGLPCDAQLQAGAPLGLCGAATDNYKASYNEDPDAPERRTWLAVHQLELSGARWQPVSDTPLTAREVTLERVDGAAGTLTLTVDVVDGPGETVQLRTGPQRGLWGPLLTIRSVDALRDEGAITVRVTVRDEQGAEHAAGVHYRIDGAIANAGPDSLEHGGPGGRWEVAGLPTATNLELGWE